MEEILHQLDNIVFFCMIYRVRYIKWCQVSFINSMGASVTDCETNITH